MPDRAGSLTMRLAGHERADALLALDDAGPLELVEGTAYRDQAEAAALGELRRGGQPVAGRETLGLDDPEDHVAHDLVAQWATLAGVGHVGNVPDDSAAHIRHARQFAFGLRFFFAGFVASTVSSSSLVRLWRTRLPSVVNQKGGSERRR